MKARTDKQNVASQLNWDKMQLVRAVGHLKLLIAKYGQDAGDVYSDLVYLEEALRRGMQKVAAKNEIKGDYLTQVPYEESRMFKRSAKQFAEARKTEQVPKAVKHRPKGYSFSKSKSKWHAQICVNYKRISLGLYDTEQQAASAVAAYRSSISKVNPPKELKETQS